MLETPGLRSLGCNGCNEVASAEHIRRAMTTRAELPGAAHLALVQGASLLHPERAVLDAMLNGWALQQQSRLLGATTISTRRRMVRRFQEFTNEYPWKWTPEDVEAWSASLMSAQRARSTIRNYQIVIALFMAYITDSRYGWA